MARKNDKEFRSDIRETTGSEDDRETTESVPERTAKDSNDNLDSQKDRLPGNEDDSDERAYVQAEEERLTEIYKQRGYSEKLARQKAITKAARKGREYDGTRPEATEVWSYNSPVLGKHGRF